MDYDSETKLKTLFYQILFSDTTDSEEVSLTIAVISLVRSMDMESQPKPESELMSLVTQAISVFHSMDLASQPELLLKLISLISQKLSHSNYMDSDYEPIPDSELKSLIDEALELEPVPELISLINQIKMLAFIDMDTLAFIDEKKKFRNSNLVSDLEPEQKIISLILQIPHLDYSEESIYETGWKMDMLIMELISLVSSIDLESQSKPESELMSLVAQAISVFHSMDMDSQPEPLLQLISLVSKKLSLHNSMESDNEPLPDLELIILIAKVQNLEPKPELISLIDQITQAAGCVYYEKEKSESDRLKLINEKKEFPNTLVSGLEPEPQLISLISHLISLNCFKGGYCEDNWKTDMLIIELISLVSSMDMESQPKPESQLMSLVAQAISVFHSMDLDSQPEPLLKLISLISQNLSHSNSMDSDYEPIPELGLMSLAREAMKLEPRPELISLLHQILYTFIDEGKNPRKSMNPDWEPERKLISLISQLIFINSLLDQEYYLDDEFESGWEFISIILKIISQVTSLDLNSQPKPASKLISLLTQAVSVFKFLDLNRQPEPLQDFINLITKHNTGATGLEDKDAQWIPFDLKSQVDLAISLTPKPKLISLIHQIISLFITKDSEPKLLALMRQRESLNNSTVSDSEQEVDSAELSNQRESADLEFFSLIHERKSFDNSKNSDLEPEMKLLTFISQSLSCKSVSQFVSLLVQSIFLVSSMDLNSQPKPESELISLTTEAINVFHSMDLNAQPKPLLQLISLVSQELSLLNSIDPETKSRSVTVSDSNTELDSEFVSIIGEVKRLKQEVELISIINQIYSVVISMNSASGKHNFLCAQLDVRLEGGKFQVTEEDKWRRNSGWGCRSEDWEEFRLKEGEDTTYFLCRRCFGENHKFNKAPVEIKHHFHPKHSLQLVLLSNKEETRKCYCCYEDLREIFHYCSACDFAMNVACAEKPPLLLAIVHPKWHEHTLALFSRQAPLACNLCAADDLSAPVYMCPPCGFVVHLRCLNLPRVIRISRHPRRISFTPIFDQEDLSCGVCRTKINNEYGGYSCIKDGFSYVAHSRCATQSNVWDGVELEGEPEETEEEELEPFVRMIDGTIRHFSHEDHLLRLNDNTDEDYDENRQCQICTTPIYFGNFYSCIVCDFVLHERCGNLSRKMHHPIHPHRLTLVGGYDGVTGNVDQCSACPSLCTVGFFYKCFGKGCNFKLHVRCATISEPLVHESHLHPLFLTSKPGDRRRCWVCKDSSDASRETFNCIECEFALCFGCAILPQKARYKHDKHKLTLCYGEEISTLKYWCDACEGELNPKERFYKCEEYCCVTLHIECLIGKDLFMKGGSSWFYHKMKLRVMLNNQHMSRPFCNFCKKRCPYSIVIKNWEKIYCSVICLHGAHGKWWQ